MALVLLLKSLKSCVAFHSLDITYFLTTLRVSQWLPWWWPYLSTNLFCFHILPSLCSIFTLAFTFFFFLIQVSLSMAPMTLYFLLLRTLHYFLFPSARNRADLSSILRQFIFWLATFFPEGSSFIPLPENRNSFLHLYIWLHLAS